MVPAVLATADHHDQRQHGEGAEGQQVDEHLLDRVERAEVERR